MKSINYAIRAVSHHVAITMINYIVMREREREMDDAVLFDQCCK